MYVDIENAMNEMEPELQLVGAIFRNARIDYAKGCRKIQRNGGLDHLNETYDKYKNIVSTFDRINNAIDEENKKIIKNNNKRYTVKQELIPSLPITEEVQTAKNYIKRYTYITKEYNEVEAFLRSEWCETLSSLSSLDHTFLVENFHEMRDEIFNQKLIHI